MGTQYDQQYLGLKKQGEEAKQKVQSLQKDLAGCKQEKLQTGAEINRLQEEKKRLQQQAMQEAGIDSSGEGLEGRLSQAVNGLGSLEKIVRADSDELLPELEAFKREIDARMQQSEQDSRTILSEKNKMKSKETIQAQQDMSSAIDASKDDSRFLGDASDKERDTRVAGEKEMSSQKSRISSYKPRRR